MKFGLVELVDIDIRSNTICSNCISTNYYGSNGGVSKIYKNFERPSKETMDILFGLIEDDENKSRMGEDNVETYYVVEVNGRYYENETVLYSDNEIFEHSVRTNKSLLECKRFYSKADAQETADKHGFVVRKVIVKVEE